MTRPKKNQIQNPYELLEPLYQNKNIKIITQNVDGLHKSPIELHGTQNKLLCPKCDNFFDNKSRDYLDEMPMCDSGTALKPNVVLFGEFVDRYKIDESKNCNINSMPQT